MREPHPLPEDLSPESREFAEALRELFAGLGITVRRYAARRRRDADTVAHYLDGTLVPRWEFVLDLLTDLAESHAPATPETVELLRGLHRAVLRTSASPGHALEVLQNQLADADREARRTSAHESMIGEVLLDRRHRIADLEVRLAELEAAWMAERGRADALEQGLADRLELVCERDRLRREVRQLTGELEEVRRRGLLAEDRCRLLERQLAAAEAQRAPAAQEPLEETAAPPAPGGPRPKILIVDDQHGNLMAMEAVLATLGQEIVSATSGQEALKALLVHDDFAVILLDVQMPGMDGYETAAQIKRRPRNRDIPVIFLTAMGADPAHSSRGYAAGAVDYIAKPVDPWALRAKVAVFTEIFLERRTYGVRAPTH
jgi:CheY-like chemotaxis protein